MFDRIVSNYAFLFGCDLRRRIVCSCFRLLASVVDADSDRSERISRYSLISKIHYNGHNGRTKEK